MGKIRAAYFGIASFFAVASVTLLIVAIALPNWQQMVFSSNGQTRVQYGLWGYKFCISGLTESCDSSKAEFHHYDDCSTNPNYDQDCRAHRKARLIAQIGLIIDASVTFLFLIYCLARIHHRFKDFADTGCCGWILLPLPLIGAIVGGICWGLYYHYNPYRKDDPARWGPCFWIAMAGWICSFVAWLPRLFYRVH